MSEQAPAGWYDDGSSGLRYWDGSAWTDHVAPGAVATQPAPSAASAAPAVPAPPTTAAPAPNPPAGMPVAGGQGSHGNALGYSAVAAAVLGLIAVVLPWTAPELIGILLIIAGFVLSGMALHRSPAKWLGYVGLAVSIIGTIVGVVMFVIGFMHGYSSAVSGG